VTSEKKKKVPFFDVAYNYVTAFDMEALAVFVGADLSTRRSKPIARDVLIIRLEVRVERIERR
jgi:hypothetical protein